MAKKATKKVKVGGGGIRHNIKKHGTRGVNRRFVPRDIVNIPWGYPIRESEIIAYLKSGYEVRIGSMKSGIRLFPYLNTDFETQRIVAQTHGDFREAIKDAPWTEGGRVEHDMDEMRKCVERRNTFDRESYQSHVSPDTMVECPKCGFNFRVGKKLV